jgi:2,3-bisphosphoglycerate-independent phosphoglycerate mutase
MAPDEVIKRAIHAAEKVNAIVVITADHGNADEMYEKSKDPNATPKPKTSHTLNPVPFYIVGKDVTLKEGNFGLANIAATLADLLEIEKDPHWLESIIA